MPGKRYNYRIIRGPWKGLRARIVQQIDAESAIVEIHSLPQRSPTVRLETLTMVKHKTPRRSKGGKKR